MEETQFNTLEEIPRYQPPNPHNFDKLTLAKKKKEVQAAIQDYPNVPPSMIEMAWDLIASNPQEEIDDIIKNGRWEKADKKQRPTGGEFKCLTIE